MASVKILQGPDADRQFEVAGEAGIGRALENEICIADGRSSRRHARIFEKDGDYWVEDCSSANGTFHNGQILEDVQPLYNGDEIVIGDSLMIFVSDKQRPAQQGKVQMMPLEGMNNAPLPGAGGGVNATFDASLSMAMLSDQERHDEDAMAGALRRMEAMCIVSEAVGNIMDRSRLMEKVIDTVFSIFPRAERAFILIRKNNEFVPYAARDRHNPDLHKEDLQISQTILDSCIRDRQSMLSNDAMADERFGNAMSIAQLSIKSMMCVPFIVAGEVLGIMQIEGTDGAQPFDESDLQVFTGIAGQVAIAVKNSMLAEAIEKESAQRANLQRYFSPNMVDMMLSGDVNTELGGKLYRGTVFFSDIIGFTAMSEAMGAEEVVANLNRYFTVMQGLIYENGGNVDKFGGDAIMAFWSVPRDTGEDERLALLTGVQMQASLWPFNLELRREGWKTIYMGIGINTGDFVAGNIGSEDKIEFTLIGDNVNLAARIEARAGKTQVLCSADTYEKVKDDVCAVELPPVMFKGKSEPQHTYSVRAVRTVKGAQALSTNIPASVLGEETQENDDFFMIVNIFHTVDGIKLFVESGRQWEIGQRLAIECLLVEFHEQIVIEGTVEMVEPQKSPSEAVGYNLYTLRNLEGERFLEIFTPGHKYITELPWEKMGRDRKVEGK